MKVPLNAVSFDEQELEEAIRVLRSGFVTMGSKCLDFEEKFANYLGVRNAVFVNSGSSANLLAFFALANPQLPILQGRKRLLPGSEVIVPALTWATTVWPIVQAGGIPVLVDCDKDTLQMNIQAVEAAINAKTVAICPVHILGNAVNMDPILSLAEKYGLWVVEDTCESLGTRYRDRYVGTLGDIGTFSFFFSHHITTIEGGMIVTNQDEIAELFRCLRAHGWTRHLKNKHQIENRYPDIDPRFLFVNTGFNLRPTEINAAFGLFQLKKLESFNKRRIEIAEEWLRSLSPLVEKKLIVPMKTSEGVYNTWFGFPVVCKTKLIRNQLCTHLEKNGIETRPVIAGNLARQPAFQHIEHRVCGSLDAADEIMDRGLYWGSHPLMDKESVKYVSEKVLGFFNNYN